MNQESKGKRFQSWFGIAISLVAVAAIIYFLRPGDVWTVIRDIDIGQVILGFLGLIGFFVLRAVRWRFMLNGGINVESGVGYLSVFHVQNVGYLVTNILPFRLGDVARVVLIGNVPPASIGQGFSTVLVERVLDMLFIAVLFPFTIATAVDLPSQWQNAVLIAGILSIVATLVFVLAANFPNFAVRVVSYICDHVPFLDTESWVNRTRNILQGLDTLTRWKDAALLLLLSIVVWLPLILSYYFVIQSLHLEATVAQAALVVCIAAFSLAAPSSPGGLGVQEAAIAFAMNGVLGLSESGAVSFALVNRTIYYVLTGIMGIVGISMLGETFGSVVVATRSLISSRSQQQVRNESKSEE